MSYEKPFLLQGLFSRPGERPGWVKELWGETGASAPSDHPIQLPFKADKGRGPEQLLKDQMDDHSLWEIRNFLRHKAGDPRAEAVPPKDELRLRTTAGKHSLGALQASPPAS